MNGKKISVISGHPYPQSFNSAIAQTVNLHDLYMEKFNPVISYKELISDISEDSLIRQHQQEIKEADGIIIIHPNWREQPPAILKGWIDLILREYAAYTFPRENVLPPNSHSFSISYTL